MNVSFPVTQEEYAVMLKMMHKAGFSDFSEYLRHVLLQAVYAKLSGK